METIDDIVADIREQNLGMPDDMECVSPLVCDMLRLADRIENAHMRETKKLRALVDGLLEAATIECASCNYDCGLNRENCIIKHATDYLEGSAE